MIDTTDIKEGDTLVSENGDVTIQIDGIDGDDIEVTDSRNYHGDGTATREEVERSIDEFGYRVVRDSALTDVKGVGDATAPKLEAATGCETPGELANAYLCGTDVAVHEHVPRRDYFVEWLSENIENLDVDATLDQVRVMLFLNEFGCNPRSSSLTSEKATSDRYGSVDETALTPDDLRWEDGSRWSDGANVAMVVLGDRDAALSRYKWYSENDDGYSMADGVTRDGDHYVVTLGDEETWVSADYLDGICEIFGVEPENSIEAYEEGGQPVFIEIEDGDLTAALAPRIRDD